MELPRLHLVTDDAVVQRADFVRRASAAVEAGGARVAIHLRAPRAGGRMVYQLARELRRVTRASGAVLLVSDRVDVAAAAGADGVQLGGRSMSPAAARRVLGHAGWVGASVHSQDEAHAARGADFLLAGTIYPSASHPGRPGAGLGLVRSLAAVGPPVVAIGGITAERAPELLRAGAHGVAVLGAVWAATDPAEQVVAFLSSLESDERR